MSGIYSLLEFNYSSDKIQNLSDGAIKNLQLAPKLIQPWQEDAIVSNNTTGYFQNPVANSANSLIANCQSIIISCNGIVELVGINVLATTIATTSGPQFLAHTDRISGISDPAEVDNLGNLVGDPSKPYYDTAIGVGRTLMYLTYQTDGIVNNSPMLGAFTSVLAKDEFNDLYTTVSPYANTIAQSITSVPIINVETSLVDGYANTTNLTFGQISSIQANLSSILLLMDTRRTHDENFFEKSNKVMNDVSKMRKFSDMGESQKYLVENFIGSDNLKQKLTIPTSLYEPSGAPIPDPNQTAPTILSVKIFKLPAYDKHQVEIRYQGFTEGATVYGYWTRFSTNSEVGYVRGTLTGPSGIATLDFLGEEDFEQNPYMRFVFLNSNGQNIVEPQTVNITDDIEVWPVYATTEPTAPITDLTRYRKVNQIGEIDISSNFNESTIITSGLYTNDLLIGTISIPTTGGTFSIGVTPTLGTETLFEVSISSGLGDFSSVSKYTGVATKGKLTLSTDDGAFTKVMRGKTYYLNVRFVHALPSVLCDLTITGKMISKSEGEDSIGPVDLSKYSSLLLFPDLSSTQVQAPTITNGIGQGKVESSAIGQFSPGVLAVIPFKLSRDSTNTITFTPSKNAKYNIAISTVMGDFNNSSNTLTLIPFVQYYVNISINSFEDQNENSFPFVIKGQFK